MTRGTESNLTGAVATPRLHGDVLRLVSGIEYEINALSERLDNIAFAKSYYYKLNSDEVDDYGAPTRRIRTREFDRARFGVGDSLRYRFSDWIYAKASYEYATRLPNVEELFGNGALISANPAIKPEVSHNVNLGPRFELKRTKGGDFIIDVNLFMREIRDLIVRIPGAVATPNSNVGRARSLGAESSTGWVSPGRWVNLSGSFTYQDVRNTAESGPFEPYNGERIPSRPWLFASWGGGLRFANLPGVQDAVEPYYAGRYTRGYARGWESIGDPQFWIRVPDMISHDVGVTYTKTWADYRLGSTVTVSNLSDARLFDTFGVERPGRAYYFKVTGEI